MCVAALKYVSSCKYIRAQRRTMEETLWISYKLHMNAFLNEIENVFFNCDIFFF